VKVWWEEHAEDLLNARQLHEREAAIICSHLLVDHHDEQEEEEEEEEGEGLMAFATCVSGLLSVSRGGAGSGTCFISAAKAYEMSL
jgi:hypothetical protein